MRRALVAAMHAGYWTLYLLVLSWLFLVLPASHASDRPFAVLTAASPIVLLAVAPNAGAFYAAYGPLFIRFLARRRLARLFAGTAAVCLATAAAGLLLGFVLFGPTQPVFSQPRETAALIALLSALAAIHVAIALVMRGFVGWYDDHPVREELTRRAHSNELVERFVQALDRVQLLLAPPTAPCRRDYIFVKTELRLEKVRLDEVLVIEGQRDYRRIHTTSKRIMTLQTFAEFERLLPPEILCRVHRSYMVAPGRIESIERGEITIGGMTIPLSDTYRDRFLALIGQERPASSP